MGTTRALLLLTTLVIAMMACADQDPVLQRRNKLFKNVQAATGDSDLGGIPLVFEHNVTMRDGVELWTLIVLPSASGGQFPTVIDRSPYSPEGTELLATLFTPFGYAAVQQNERSTGKSGGKWTFWHTAADDMQDTLAWIQKQPWSNGQVFGMGASADGVLLQQSAKLPDMPLLGTWSIWTTSAPYLTAFQGGGAPDGPANVPYGGALRWQLTRHWLEHMQAYHKSIPPNTYWENLLTHEGEDEWWMEVTVNSTDYSNWNYNQGAHWGGWYDIFLQDTIDTFHHIQNHAGPTSKGAQKLIIDTRGHCMFESVVWFPSDRLGDVWSFEQALAAFDAVANHSAARPTPLLKSPDLDTYTLYIMGPSRDLKVPPPPPPAAAAHARTTTAPPPWTAQGMYWTTLPEWPQATPTTLYLNPASMALVDAPPTATDALSYNYDPADPVPTIGGNNLFMACGPLDQASLAGRPDVITFTTAPFESNTAVVGTISVTLWVSSNATNTDFTVKINDVYPKNRTQLHVLISDNILNMMWRHNNTVPVLMEPGQVYPITIDLWPTAYVFAQGHQLELSISSSNFPRFAANPNNGKPLDQGGPLLVAKNTLHFGADTPASLTLPIVDMADIPPNVDV